MTRKTPAALIDEVSRCLGISREAAASLSILTIVDLRRVGVLPPPNAEKEMWVR